MKTVNYSPKYFKQNFPEWKRKKPLPIKFFVRPVSFYFSSLFYKLGFTSNQVSFLSLLVGIGSCICFFFVNTYIQLLGAMLITVWAILDAVDGNLARNVKSYPYGDFIDSMSSYTIVALIFPIIGFTVYREGGHFVDAGNGAIILLGAFASIFDTLAQLIYQKITFKIVIGRGSRFSFKSFYHTGLVAYNNIKEPINELAFMLAKQASIPILNSNENDIRSDGFLFELANGLIISGLSMTISGDTRGTSGAEHLISHAIDEFFPGKSTVHGLQVGWAHLMIEKKYRNNLSAFEKINSFFEKIGLLALLSEMIPWNESDFEMLIPYAIKVRNRYTIFNQLLIKH